MAYRKKRGTLNIGMRVEWGAALLAALYANTNSKKGGYKIHDFMLHEEETPINIEKAMETWR